MSIEIVVIMKTGGWWYKDRLGRSRGPCELITLKTAYGAGIIDRDTFIWGEDMDEWAPIHMVYGLEPAIATWEGLYMGEFEISREFFYCRITIFPLISSYDFRCWLC